MNDADFNLSPHFALSEFVRDSCDRSGCALPFSECVDNLQALCVMVIEPWRIVVGPLVVNSGLRDTVFSKSLATDPASLARVTKDGHVGPHETGESGDFRVMEADAAGGVARNRLYVEAFVALYRLAQRGLPVHEAILEYGKGDAANPTSQRITHIHVQYQSRRQPARRFVARKWVVKNGVLCESYVPWKP
jgi:hypothetical protein